MFDKAAIEAAIPHRPPMLLIDEIVHEETNLIRCRKSFRSDEFFVQGHFPGQPIVPGVILCEATMQAGAILLSRQFGAASGIPVATRLDGVKFKKLVQPGDTAEIEVKLNEAVSNAYFLTGKVTVDGKLAARLEFACTMLAEEGSAS